VPPEGGCGGGGGVGWGGVGVEWGWEMPLKITLPGLLVVGLVFRCIACVSVFLVSITICGLYKLTLSEHARLAPCQISSRPE